MVILLGIETSDRPSRFWLAWICVPMQFPTLKSAIVAVTGPYAQTVRRTDRKDRSGQEAAWHVNTPMELIGRLTDRVKGLSLL